MHSKEQVEVALKTYHQTNSVGATVQKLCYPTRHQLYVWLGQEGIPKSERKKLPKLFNSPEHPRNPSLNIKLEAIKRCYEQGESVESVSKEIGYTRASIYAWRKKYLKKGAVALMNNNKQPGELKAGTPSTTEATLSAEEVAEIKAQMQNMQLEIDILKEIYQFIKKRSRCQSNISQESRKGSAHRSPKK